MSVGHARDALDHRRYTRLMELVESERCIVLDGAVGTELIDVGGTRPETEEHLWGVSALLDAPDDVRAVHRRYVEAGCDVITTDTWALPSVVHEDDARRWHPPEPVHWMDLARRGIQLARTGAAEAGREREVAVAFSVNGDLDTPEGPETIRLLDRAFENEPPDLILLESLSLVRESTYATVEALIATGLPVWLSFRRCRHGVCGIYGEHWGGPEGDAFGRAARRFEEIGVDALLINCLPPDHATGMVSWLRDFTDLPLGVYPNLGYLSSTGWRHADDIDGEAYAQLAMDWREEGAQIIGGCCGVGPELVGAAAVAVRDTVPGRARPASRPPEPALGAEAVTPASWTDPQGQPMVPLPFPSLAFDPGVAAPTQAGFLVWKHLHRHGVGAHERCLDLGCGSGLLAIQLARNSAAHVHAIDVDEAAVRTTLHNAFRNGVADRVTAAVADLYPWVPEERYDVIVADLPQTPSEPLAQATSHRPGDFWGRNLLDHLIRLLPEALAPDGVAYLVQQSILGQQRTIEGLARAGFVSRVLDVAFDVDGPRTDRSAGAAEQLARVERQSDAYHLTLGEHDVIVDYLLEVRHAAS